MKRCPALWESQLLERPSGLPFDQDSEPTIDTGANCIHVVSAGAAHHVEILEAWRTSRCATAGARDQADRDRARSRLKL
jgi:hypothetical protein